MKFTTSNAKCPSYATKHTLYVGTHTGSFKKIEPFREDPYAQKNLQQIAVLDKTSKVTCMAFGNEQHSEILVGRANHFVKVFDCATETNSSSFEVGDGEVVGLGRSNGCIVAGLHNGTVKIVKYPDIIEFNAGESLAKLRICAEDQNLMVTGGKSLKQIIKVWDLEAQKTTFTAKNVRKDMLELEQPIWENDVLFIDKNTIASCSRYGYVRVYDLRGPQRRPVQGYSAPDDQLSFTSLASHAYSLYAGTTIVGARAFDIRKMKNHVHVYKGFTGTITSVQVDPSGNHIFTSCLDRYVRIHNAVNTAMLYQCYVKSKPMQILAKSYVEVEGSHSDEEVVVLENQEDREIDEEYEDMFSKMATVKESVHKKRKHQVEETTPKLPKLAKKKKKVNKAQ